MSLDSRECGIVADALEGYAEGVNENLNDDAWGRDHEEQLDGEPNADGDWPVVQDYLADADRIRRGEVPLHELTREVLFEDVSALVDDPDGFTRLVRRLFSLVHAPECAVVRDRAELAERIGFDPDNQVWIGALIENYGGGDQEVECCTCGAVDAAPWCLDPSTFVRRRRVSGAPAAEGSPDERGVRPDGSMAGCGEPDWDEGAEERRLAEDDAIALTLPVPIPFGLGEAELVVDPSSRAYPLGSGRLLSESLRTLADMSDNPGYSGAAPREAERVLTAAVVLFHAGAGSLAECLDTAIVWERG